MQRAPGLFDLDERLALPSQKGDALERLAKVIDFEVFRPSWNGPCRGPIVPRVGGRRSTTC